MNEISIIDKAIRNEKLAIKDQAIFATSGALLSILLVFFLTIFTQNIDEDKSLATIPSVSGIFIGVLTIPNPAKEIIERRENIRLLKTLKDTYEQDLEQRKREKYIDLIEKLYSI